MNFLPESFCLSAATVSLARQRHDILDFGCCPVVMWHWPICESLDLSFIWGYHHLHLMDDRSTSRLVHVRTMCWRDPARLKQLSVAILSLQFGLYHVVVPLSFPRSNQPWIIVTKTNNRPGLGITAENQSYKLDVFASWHFNRTFLPQRFNFVRKEKCSRHGPKLTPIACINHNNFTCIIAVNVPSLDHTLTTKCMEYSKFTVKTSLKVITEITL